MKRSLNVSAPLLASAALTLLTACRNPQMQRCVDQNNHVVDGSLCRNQPNQSGSSGSGIGYIPMPYRYYYGGGGSYDLGSTVTGGGYVGTPGVSYSTTRGGFGSTFGGGDSDGSGAHGGSGE
jgi:hypothetical protein